MIDPTDADGRHFPTVGSQWSEKHRLIGFCEITSGQIGPSRPVGTQTGSRVVVAFQVGHHIDPSRRPRAGTAASGASVSIGGRPPVVIGESDLEMPARGWELRCSGLWVECVCEAAMEHWSYGLEAFGLAIEDPAEFLGRGHGERTHEWGAAGANEEPRSHSDVALPTPEGVWWVPTVLE